MDNYRPFFISVSLVVAWWAIASLGYARLPVLPDELMRLLLLAAASAWMLYVGWQFKLQERRYTALFMWTLALAPFGYYAEIWYITTHSVGLTEHTIELNKLHSTTVFNAFRYFLLIVNAFIIIKEVMDNLRGTNR